MRNLAVIPARSGSKGLKDKNIRFLNGKPLLAYSIDAAMKSEMFDEIMVSTESKKYASIARELGASVPFMRSVDLATDVASSWDVVREVTERYKEIGEEFDAVALLQPTSPLRSAEDIIAGYSVMRRNEANAVVGVCEVDHSPLWCNTLPEDGSLDDFLRPNLIDVPRQSLPTYYRVNGALYIVKTEYLRMTQNIYAVKSFAVVMSKEHSVDIDDELDFIIAETLMKHLEKE